MKFPPFVHRWFNKLNLPLGLLTVLLQRTPAVRVVATAAEFVLASPMGNILKSSLATAAALGAVNSMAGATELASSTPSPAQLTVGVNTNIAFGVTGTLGDATSWSISGSVPPGLTFQGGRTTGSINAGTLTLSGTPTTAGNYSISMVARYDPLGINSPTFNYSFTVTGPANVAPNITTQPQNQTVTAGANVSFTGGANGTPAPTLQWRKNGNDIGGATGTTLTLNNVQAGDAGNYTLVATNGSGTATSNIATLTVNAAPSAPVFTVHPAGQTVIAGNNVFFFAAADGNPAPTYQWRFNGADIGGATNSTLTLFNVQAGNTGTYTVVATNGSGSVVSNPATLTVNPATTPPSFTTQPVDQIAIVGNTLTLTAVAAGNPAPTFQWQKDGADVAGANAASLSFNPVRLGDAGTYRVVATNSVASFPSVHAVITVVNPFALADFDGDGQSDLVWQNTQTGERRIWLMNGTNIASDHFLVTLPLEWTIAATGDFNGDRHADLVWTNTQTGEHRIWIMNGTTLAYDVPLVTLPLEWTLSTTGDFNGDGNSDLVWTNTQTGEHRIWIMNGTALSYDVSLGTLPLEWTLAATGDFNRDGKSDLVWQNTATGERRLWIMNGTALAYDFSMGELPLEWTIAAVGDFNADGNSDIVWSNTLTGSRIVWFLNGTAYAGGGTFGTVSLEWLLGRPDATKHIAADFNADGKSDLLWQNTATGERLLWLMNGTGYGSSASLGSIPVEWSIATTGDFNGDGKPDIVWQNTATGERLIWFMNGAAFGSSVSLGVVPVEWSIATSGDLNYDGKPDLIWQNTVTGERIVWFMDGTVISSSASLGTVSTDWSIAVTGDFNGDGKTDLLWQNTSTGERYIWLMNGTALSASVYLGTIPVEWSIAASGDFNADGKSDLVWQNTATGERIIWLMNGTAYGSAASLGVVPVEWRLKN